MGATRHHLVSTLLFRMRNGEENMLCHTYVYDGLVRIIIWTFDWLNEDQSPLTYNTAHTYNIENGGGKFILLPTPR